MGNTDSLPVVSQVKSVVQVIGGDSEGAKRTQANFVKGCPIVSQGVALGATITGNLEYAIETQRYFVQNMSNVADSIPVVGHVKGGIHYICGDKDGGDSAMKSASRTVFVAGGGIGGFIVLGPVGAVAGGIAGGAVGDAVITGVDSAAKGEYRPYGHLNNIQRAIDGDLDIGGGFDWVASFVFDGLAGRGFGQLYKNIRAASIENSNFRQQIQNAVEKGDITLEQGQSITSLANELQAAARQLKEAVKQGGTENIPGNQVGTTVIDIDGNRHVGYSFRLRNALNIDAFEGEVPSAHQILEARFPGGAPSIRGMGVGEASCAEVHALHQFHRTNGLAATPARTITVVYDGTGVKAAVRCGNCKSVGKYVNMGKVVTDSSTLTNAGNIPLDNVSVQAAMDLLQAEGAQICDCGGEHEKEKKLKMR